MGEFSIQQMADRLSLIVSEDDGRLGVTRLERRITIAPHPLAGLEMTSVASRHVAFCVLTGIRLGLDRLQSDYEPGQATQKPNRPLRYHEQPSIYGERLPRLVPRLVTQWFEAITTEDAFVTEWHLDPLEQIYVLETGKTLHTLTVSDIAATEHGADKIRRNGRHALFYDSYKLKPRATKRYPGGLVRIFHTVEGLGASRAVLLPDFDYDAAREGGSFAIPSRDTMIIGRPEEPEHADEIAARVADLAGDELVESTFPLCNRVWRMTDKAVADSSEFSACSLPVSDWTEYAPEQFAVESLD